MRNSRIEVLACSLWAAAVSAMVFGTVDSVRVHHNSVALAWGIFVALMALVPSAIAVAKWAISADEASVERIVEVVDALHEGRKDVSRLH